jgi:N-acetylglucosaminyldiphosphoundecaprenol N-acetyl-beta-D-mannosaminyltransferase
MSPEKIKVLTVNVSVLNLKSAANAVLDSIKARRKGYVCVTGVHGIIEAQDDESFRNILNHASLCTPDGVPLVWVGRAQYGKSEMGRVYGPDLMWELFRISDHQPIRHFFYGGKEGVADLLKDRLLQHFPNAIVAGTYCPPFRPLTANEEVELANQVREARPDIMWIGLSTPKQERFMAAYLDKLDTTLMIGVGAAFDFYAGLVPQAPVWIQKSGLEWLYRLTKEPKRLWNRYSRIVPRFLFLITRQMLASSRSRLSL